MIKPIKPKFIFEYSYWDIIPSSLGVLHLSYLIFIVLYFNHLTLPNAILLGLIYAISISWNINGIAHNFINNPYFKSQILNRVFSVIESITIIFSQTFYDAVHKRHHMGNSDRQNDKGDTIDWLSISIWN